MKLYAVIMAGGVGSRFWPRSKKKKPKQMLKIFGENTLIQNTVERLEGLVPKGNIYVITNKEQKDGIAQQIPEIPVDNIIAEPFGKNTAACIGLASVLVNHKDNDSVMVTLPADHLIFDTEKFQHTLNKAAEFALNSKGLLTIGITPTRPETGYGYIQYIDELLGDNIYKVRTFAEKPNISTAKRFLESGDFLWNSGMFIWKADSILSEIQLYLPDLHSGLLEIQNAIGKPNFEETLTSVYGQLKNISIDYGVMEKSKNVYLTKADFQWSDVGSWEEVYQLSDKDENGNVKVGKVYSNKTYNSYIYSKKKFAAVIGVHNLIVINTKDALLICNRDNAQDVKKVVDYLKMKNETDLL